MNRFASFILRLIAKEEALTPYLQRVVLLKAAEKGQSLEQRQQILDEWRGPFGDLAANVQFFEELFLVRHIENYLAYLSSLLFEIFTTRPEAMRSQEKIDVEFVLSHRSFDSLVRGLAERKVEALSYASFNHLAGFFREHFGLDICSSSAKSVLSEFIETRNISVHNRCRVSRRYLERVPGSTRTLGELRGLGGEDTAELVDIVHASVRTLDAAARRKLRLVGTRFDVGAIIAKQHDSGHETARRVRKDTLKQDVDP